jgi:uncharacterized protein YjbI with pentapeptide repeats
MEQQNDNTNHTIPDPKPSATSTKSSFKPLHVRNLIPGMLIGVLIGIVGFLAYEKHLPQVTRTLYNVTLTAFGVLIVIFVLIYAFKRQITKLIFGSATANAGEVIEDAQRVTDALTDRFADTLLHEVDHDTRQRIRHVLPRLTNWFIWSRFRNWWWQWLLGIFVSLSGLTGTLLLMNQNKLLENQNALIQRQMSLEEASRRGALVVLMSNIMDKVDDEIKEQRSELLKKGISKAAVDTMKFSLSQSLVGQIVALSHSFKPYRFLNADTLIDEPLSPERGLLLITLTLLPLDTCTFDKIYKSALFKNADLRYAVLDKAYLSGANLSRANLSRASLRKTNLRKANLSGVDLSAAHLNDACLISTNLNAAILRVAFLDEADLSDAFMSCTDLRGAYLNGTRLKGADLRFAVFNLRMYSGISFQQLETVKTLIGVTGLHDSLSIPLHKAHPHLFEPPKD